MAHIDDYQERVLQWMMTCFGEEITADQIERNHRFLEESLELVQSTGCSKSEAHQLVEYVFNRPIGDPPQEVGGVMVTLAALCIAAKLSMAECGETELARVWTCVEKIRAKQASKPRYSPLPEGDGLTIADYEEAFADHKRLVRELDVILNGEEGAAKQASLCDIVSQVRDIKGLWKPASTAPMDGTEIYMRQLQPMRYKLYKPNSQEFKRGIKGRWQSMTDYGGWENCSDTNLTEWCTDEEGNKMIVEAMDRG